MPASRKLQAADAAGILESASLLVVSMGRKVSEFSGDSLSSDEAVKAMLGRTGNLRAPTARVGETVLVGFNEDVYSRAFG